jgi:Ca-activated chloride channel homolog
MVIVWSRSLSSFNQLPKAQQRFSYRCTGTLQRTLFVLVVALAVSGYTIAQMGRDEVHVLPRTDPAFQAPAQPALRANVDLVLVNVTVLDRADRAVTGLRLSNFAVVDDKSPQVIRYLSNEDEPISLVVVLDVSASMAVNIQEARKAFAELIDASNPQDDFGMIVVNDKARVGLRFDDSASEIRRAVAALQPDGSTALWDGMYLGIEELKKSHHQRKAMVVISDGGDNHSRHTESELKSLLKEADVEVYAVGMFNRNATRLEERKGPLQLDEVTSVTGGRLFSVHGSAELSRAVTQISLELRNQYVLGYYPSNRSRDGKWRRLKIRLTGLASQEKIRLYAKKGYYAPAE